MNTGNGRQHFVTNKNHDGSLSFLACLYLLRICSISVANRQKNELKSHKFPKSSRDGAVLRARTPYQKLSKNPCLLLYLLFYSNLSSMFKVAIFNVSLDLVAGSQRLNLAKFQGWRTGESTRLPLMWPGIDSRIRRHMWVEFVGSLLGSEWFFFGYCGFPLSSETNISFDLF